MRGKKLLSLLLAVTLACSMPLTACAANDVTIEATSASLILAEASGYTDVPTSAWYADAVEYVREHGVMNGTGNGKFSPEATFTRAQFATVLYRIAGESAVTGEDAFGDTEAGQWYSDAVLWSAQQGIFQGYGDKFGTNDPVTQEQMVTVLWRYTGEPQPKENAVTDDTSAYALDAIRWARGSGVIDEAAGYTFAAKQTATRALVAVILTAYLTASFEEEPPVGDTLTLSVGGTELDVAWEDNASVDALRELVRSTPLTVQMSMYGGFEQVGALGSFLPRNDTQTTTEPGDIVLYSGNQIVMFYGSNSWAYTRLGRITGMSGEELTALLGVVGVTATLSLTEGKTETTAFAFTTKTVRLNSGYDMPILGLGTWTLSNEQAENAVYHALKDGYRLIDTARYYGNEVGVGKGIQKAIREGVVKREDVFVTSKVMPSDYGRAAQGIDDSLRDLGLDYLDLMLIHQPGSNDRAVYQALEQGVKDGKLRSIGISNYYTKAAFDEVLSYAEITPAVVQNENHLYYQNTALRDYVKQCGTVVESWYPFGGRGHTQEHFGNETVQAIASAHGKTAAQTILRWQLQAGFIAIPGSGDPEHIAENYDVFDFKLSDAEMARIAALDRQQRYESW